jgi:hypothetical protein
MRAGVERWAPWVAGLTLLVLSAGFAVTQLGRPDGRQLGGAQARVHLDPKARLVAQAFVQTAVARRDLAGAWWLVAPSLRGGLTAEQWQRGSIPVRSYPVATARVVYRTKLSYADRALLEVTFQPRSGSLPKQFLLGLRRSGGPWLVTSWSAVSTIAPAPRA